MKIAIIGGGAAGMATAYLLDKQHTISVFEKQAILGGNIRTLNKNVLGTGLDSDLVLDCGVIEFQRQHFPYFHQLMSALEIPVIPGHSSSELFLLNGQSFKSGAGILHDCQNLPAQLAEIRKILPICLGYFKFLLNAWLQDPKSFHDQPMSKYLNHGLHALWLKMLLMYAYSMPYLSIADFPAEIGMPMLQQSDMFTQWDRIVGGVYSYIEKIVQTISGTIYTSANIQGIRRDATGVTISLYSGEQLFFDQVVFAVTPDQVLGLLTDASAEEQRRFGAWQSSSIETVIHTDISFYKHFGVSYYSEFDVFQNKLHGECGYNAYLNRLYQIDPAKYQHFSLAYNLSKLINPDSIIHTQQHPTPFYSVAALHYRHEIIACNGENMTWHAGAYLGNGLHEGAIASAYAVAELLV